MSEKKPDTVAYYTVILEIFAKQQQQKNKTKKQNKTNDLAIKDSLINKKYISHIAK